MAEVLRSWARKGIRTEPASVQAELGQFSRKHSVVLPDDFAAYLLATGGMVEGESDEHGIRFWRLSEVTPLDSHVDVDNDEHGRALFVFADYSLWAHGYAIRLSHGPGEDSGAIFLVGTPDPVRIAPTFAHFIQLYLHQPQQLFVKTNA